MTDQELERLKDACVIIVEGFARAAEAIKSALAGFEAKAMGIDPGRVWEDDMRDPLEDLRRAIDEMNATDYFAALAVDPEGIPPPKKTPRPPKCLGPVNKANYAANRPPRRARSSCRTIKR